MESGVRRENRKAVIDKIAAVFILQNYLDFRSTAKEGVNADAKEGVNADAEEENHE